MASCPKCKQRYTSSRRGHKTNHHIIPQRLFKNRNLPPGAMELLMEFTIDLCRSCHDDINKVIEEAEREVLYVEHQSMYREVLQKFLSRGGKDETNGHSLHLS